MGLLLAVVVTSAAFADPEGACKLIDWLDRTDYPRLRKMWADSKYHNCTLYARIRRHGERDWEREIVSRNPGTKGGVLLPKRWVVERTFAWLGRYRIHSKDYERLTSSSEGMIQVSMIHLMLKRLKPSKQYAEFKYRPSRA